MIHNVHIFFFFLGGGGQTLDTNTPQLKAGKQPTFSFFNV